MTEDLVCDASVMVGLLTSSVAAAAIAPRMSGHAIHVPAHFDAEVLSALGRLQRAGEIPPEEVARHLDVLARAPYERHLLGPLLGTAWQRRADVRLVDALYIALAEKLGAPILTLDRGLAASAPRAELLEIRAGESAKTRTAAISDDGEPAGS